MLAKGGLGAMFIGVVTSVTSSGIGAHMDSRKSECRTTKSERNPNTELRKR
jgi:hypothetical protein